MKNLMPGWLCHAIKATQYALKGLVRALKSEVAFRQEVVLFILLCPLAWWLGQTALGRCLLIGVLFLVLIVELLNSAIEAVVDRISHEHHALAGKAKDLGAAAVFVAIVQAIVVWLIVLIARA